MTELIHLAIILYVTVFVKLCTKLLGMDEINYVCLSGIKVIDLGVPTNLDEGLAILAKKKNNLRFIDLRKISGSFSLTGKHFSLQVDESNYALAGEITVDGIPIIMINTHLSAAPPSDSTGVKRRLNEINELAEFTNDFPDEKLKIIGGDFNAVPNSNEIKTLLRAANLFDTFADDTTSANFTWDPKNNANIAYSTNELYTGTDLNESEIKTALYDTVPRRIDYILLSGGFAKKDITKFNTVFNKPVNGVFPSDHYGAYAEIDVSNYKSDNREKNEEFEAQDVSSFEPLPIISYDTDVGLGYGFKTFFLNFLGFQESFDIVFFNSTKGERWYRVVYSIPDFELRQGQIYPLAVDITVDYDKWIKNSFFGIGNSSKFEDRIFYTREPLEISLTASRAFRQSLICQIGIKYKSIRNYNYSKPNNLNNPNYKRLIANPSKVDYSSFILNIRYDTRNSFINPSHGVVIQAETEFIPDIDFNDAASTKFITTFQYYTVLFYPKTIFAYRLSNQVISGSDLPLQVFNSIGGNQTLRGYPQDRFLGRISTVSNLELRFPLWFRFGGVLGYDIGCVYDSVEKVRINSWHHNSNIGLRLYMETFIVRLDVGFSEETTGFYFNFGHIF